MGILTKMILDFIGTGIGILEFFIIVRLLLMWWQIKWLVPFDTAGKDLVNSFADVINKYWRRWRNSELSIRGRLIVGMIALIAIRNLLPVVVILL
jgi:hypothetical protein